MLSCSDLQKHGLMEWEPMGDYKQVSTFADESNNTKPSEMPLNITEFWLMPQHAYCARWGGPLYDTG